MSKPEPAGGSLEGILASIRKSLAEQSTDALNEAAAAKGEPENDARTRRQGLTQRLAGAAPQAASGEGETADDLSDLLEAPAGDRAEPGQPVSTVTAAGSSTAGTASAEASANKDPLWFLTRRDEPTAGAGSPTNAGTTSPAPEPSLTRPEVVRASMPPFFGSSAEMPAPTPPATATTAQAVTASLAAAPAARPAPGSEAAVVPPTPPSSLNGRAHAADGGDTSRDRTLEAMVLDLLEPMLREWLDQNMPRLVAQALSEEARRARAAPGDAKKA